MLVVATKFLWHSVSSNSPSMNYCIRFLAFHVSKNKNQGDLSQIREQKSNDIFSGPYNIPIDNIQTKIATVHGWGLYRGTLYLAMKKLPCSVINYSSLFVGLYGPQKLRYKTKNSKISDTHTESWSDVYALYC